MIDTQLAVWTIENDPRLGELASALITTEDADILVSAVSLWEIAIKYPLRCRQRDPIRMNAAQARDRFERSGMAILPVMPRHAIAIDALPPLHGDPFDRLPVAQAMAEGLPFLTRDKHLQAYSALVELV